MAKLPTNSTTPSNMRRPRRSTRSRRSSIRLTSTCRFCRGNRICSVAQPAQALAVAQRLIAADKAAGRKPDESYFRLAVQAAFDAKSPQLADYAQQWLTDYPSPDAWRNNLVIYRNSANLDENGRLALLRLINATGGLKSADDYNSYISGAPSSNFNEAHTILDRRLPPTC